MYGILLLIVYNIEYTYFWYNILKLKRLKKNNHIYLNIYFN